jgi:hypothetical protein
MVVRRFVSKALRGDSGVALICVHIKEFRPFIKESISAEGGLRSTSKTGSLANSHVHVDLNHNASFHAHAIYDPENPKQLFESSH